jgi:hypothetical protein
MPMRKIKGSNCFEMSKVRTLLIGLKNFTNVAKYVQCILIAPIYILYSFTKFYGTFAK